MKLLVDAIELRNALKSCMLVVPLRPSHPILANFLLKADGDFLTVIGFNLASGISISVDAEVKESGEITVPAQTFTNLVEKLPDGQVALEGEKNDDGEIKQLLITSLSGTYNLSTVSSAEFPVIPTPSDDAQKIKINQVLLTGLSKVSPFVSDDETKRVLTGVNIKTKDGLLAFATSDGHRLSVFKKEDESIKDSFEVTIPAKAIKLFKSIFESVVSDNDVFMTLDKEIIFVETGNNYLIARSLEGTFPAYQNLIPNKFKGSAVVDRKELLSCVERLDILAKETKGVVKIDITKEGVLSISAEAKEIGNGNEKISASSDINITLAVNCKYLLEAIKAFSAEEIKINFTTPTTPIVINPLSVEDHVVLLMPIQLRGE